MSKLEFKAEQLIEPGFRNVKAEQIRAKRYRDRAQAIYDAHLETLPKVYLYKRLPGKWREEHIQYPDSTHTARLDDLKKLDAMEKLK